MTQYASFGKFETVLYIMFVELIVRKHKKGLHDARRK